MITQEQNQLLNSYNEALVLYKKRNFTQAKAKFLEGLGVVPADGPCQLYIERCDEYIKNPPNEDWDGVFIMTTK